MSHEPHSPHSPHWYFGLLFLTVLLGTLAYCVATSKLADEQAADTYNYYSLARGDNQ